MPVFKKQERLCSKKTIERLFTQGNVIHCYPFKILWEKLEREQEWPVKIAISVSKKNFTKAVDRNALKRRIREAYRLNKHVLYKCLTNHHICLAIFMVYIAKNSLSYKEIEKSMLDAIAGLKKKLI